MASDRNSAAKRERDRRYRERFRQTHGGLSPSQWRTRNLRALGVTEYQVRQARRELRLGPSRNPETYLTTNRATMTPGVARMDRENRAWSQRMQESAILGQYDDGQFRVDQTGPRSRQGLAILANQYHPERAQWSPRYIEAFWRAMVDPRNNYDSYHDSETHEPTDFVGAKPMAPSAWRQYVVNFAEVVANVDTAQMDEWFDERYARALG